MKTMRWRLLPAVLMVVSVAAQDKPDFSGRWVLEDPLPAAADTPRAMTIRQSLTRTTVHGKPMEPYWSDVVVEREFADDVRSETHRIGIVGGTVTGAGTGRAGAGSEGTSTAYSVTWDAKELVIQTGSYSPPAPGTRSYRERKEVWSLDERGRLVVTVTNRSSDTATTTQMSRYRRE
jgi:hypothetical protein